MNTYWTKDTVYWELMNFVQGGGISILELYSSNEWSRTIINGRIVFLGVWGLTLNVFTSYDSDGVAEVMLNLSPVIYIHDFNLVPSRSAIHSRR